MHRKTKVLFILKRRNDYNPHHHSAIGLSTGLYNSANFMNDMLNEMGIESHLVVVVDNNAIDREVTKYKPTHVIIEALWVVPTKFTVLCKLHPGVKWIIRLHSEVPFLANEGMAMDWIGDYTDFESLYIACNSPRTLEEIRYYCKERNFWDQRKLHEKVIYLPNYYPQDYLKKPFKRNKKHLDVGCFGAIRPLKNQLLQAISAIMFADELGKKLRFHINVGRVESKGEPILHNLRALFENVAERGHELIEHRWCPREEFLKICHRMDIGMQASFSETFNIVAADFISQGVPLVASKEIPWVNSFFCGNPSDSSSICDALRRTWFLPQINAFTNKFFLTKYTNKTKRIWYNYFKNKHPHHGK